MDNMKRGSNNLNRGFHPMRPIPGRIPIKRPILPAMKYPLQGHPQMHEFPPDKTPKKSTNNMLKIGLGIFIFFVALILIFFIILGIGVYFFFSRKNNKSHPEL